MFAQRLLTNQLLQLHDRVSRVTTGKSRLGKTFERHLTQLDQPPPFSLRRQLRIRLTTPQSERLGQLGSG